MSGLFSSPGKQASQGAGQLQNIDNGLLTNIENYVGKQQQQLHGAIAGIDQNPYFNAAQAMNPGAYAVNPGATETFGTSAGPGTHMGTVNAVAAGPTPPPWKPPEPKDGGGQKMQPPHTGGGPTPPPGGWGLGGNGWWGGGATGHGLT